MFLHIFLFEIKQGLKRTNTWIFFGINFLLGILFVGITANWFGGSASESKEQINSALAIVDLLKEVNTGYIGILLLVSLIAPAIYKDFESNAHQIYYSKPISKFGYFFGRFFGSFVIVLVVVSGATIAHMLAANSLFVVDTKLHAFSLWNYLQSYIYIIIPNTLLIGVILFSIVTYTRNITFGYVMAVVISMLVSVVGIVTGNLDNKIISGLLDPFGKEALSQLTEYWSAYEKNNLDVPFYEILLYNRLFWLAIAAAILIYSYVKFEFSAALQNVTKFNFFTKKSIHNTDDKQIGKENLMPPSSKSFSLGNTFTIISSLTRMEFWKLVKSPMFAVLAVTGVIAIGFSIFESNTSYGTKVYPVTIGVVNNIQGIFGVFLVLIYIFFAGSLVWKEKDIKVDELVNATPIRNITILISKILILVFVTFVFNLIGIIVGIICQLTSGFNFIELGLFFKILFLKGFITQVFLITACVAFQSMAPNKYIGYLICILFIFVLPIIFSKGEIDNVLYKIMSGGPNMPYSDLNGMGHSLGGYFTIKWYWLCFAIVTLLFGALYYQRGKESVYKQRLNYTVGVERKAYYKYLVLFVVLFALSGCVIYYNTHVLNKYFTAKEIQENVAAFEKKYKYLSKTPQPKIVSVDVRIDIYPTTQIVEANGTLVLKNKLKVAIDTLVINYNQELVSKSFENINIDLLQEDKINGIAFYKLKRKLMPGDSITFKFKAKFANKGFKNAAPNTQVVDNGTFFNNSYIIPSFGYSKDAELSDKEARKKYGLKPKDRMPDYTDTNALMVNALAQDADWIRYNCVISTNAEQTAISPGYLQSKKIENGRAIFHYKMDTPILNFYAFQSANYDVAKDKWNDVSIEIYHSYKHKYNIAQMIKAIKKSLDYYTQNFGPYQFKQLRIIEFPLYASFAQSFPNTIPFSESIGFIAKPDTADIENVDYTYFVTAHEVAHQWWGHQVIPANVKGSFMNVESMAEYSALRVMEKEYGALAMQKFLKYELDKYLKGRAQDNKAEDPLMKCEGQQYIHYQKGAMIMYALSDLIGEKNMNNALKSYVSKVKFQEPPYTTSLELVNFLKAATPDSLQYLIQDYFEKITLYELRTNVFKTEKQANGKYKTTVTVEAHKFYSDEKGKKAEQEMNDWLDISAFDVKDVKKRKTIFNKKFKIKKGIQNIVFYTNINPFSVGIDSFNKMIDRHPKDNLRDKDNTSKPIPYSELLTDPGDNSVTITL